MRYHKHLIFIVIMCLFLSACNNGKQDFNSPVTFYYQAMNIDYNNPEGVLISEEQESAGHEGDYAYLIGQYLEGPVSGDCVSPFPKGTKLESIDLLKDKVNIVLSSDFARLTGHKLTIACTCLAKTVMEMTDLETIAISAKDTLLDGEMSIKISKDDFNLKDNNAYIPDNSQ